MPTLNWVGKDKVVNHHHEVPFRVLNKVSSFAAPDGLPKNSTENRIIHGDNLEALKSLLPEFEGQVKCIYIDPPYNTGNEGWVYNDAVNDPKIKRWLGQVVGKDGEDLSRHDKWLCMMYPRLKILHRLLARDGVLFVSLDDNEISSMTLLLREIFGENNFLAQIIVQSNRRGQTYKQIAKTHEYLICFGKTPEAALGELETDGSNLPEQDAHGKYSSRELRNRNPKFGKHNRPNLFYAFYPDLSAMDEDGNFPVMLNPTPGAVEILPYNSLGGESCWRWGADKVVRDTAGNGTKVLFARQTRDGGWRVFEKYRKETVKAKSIWTETKHISEQGTTELGRLGLADKFEFPKPLGVIEDCLALATDEDSIVLDSFAGSGTTAQAVLKLNAQDGGRRRFILIEMMPYADHVTSERVKRVIAGHGDAVAATGGGFDFYTVGEPIFSDEDGLNEAVGVDAIRGYVSHSEGIPVTNRVVADNPHSPYLIGMSSDTAWVFNYEPDRATSLDMAFLSELRFGGSTGASKPARVIIYADKCLLSANFMTRHGIIFKKIPRDITRF